MNTVKINLTESEKKEFLESTGFDRNQLEIILQKFVDMLNQMGGGTGKVDCPAFCKYFEFKPDSFIAKKIFDKLDTNEDGFLTFFDLMGSLHNLYQDNMKVKLKFYYELFCDENKVISRAKMLKIGQEICSQFPHLALPDDFLLNLTTAKKTRVLVQKPAKFGGVQTNVAESGIEETKFQDDSVTLDEFFDDFEKIYYALI
jgi:Ca2+-binding EF-hand superfamily protein